MMIAQTAKEFSRNILRREQAASCVATNAKSWGSSARLFAQVKGPPRASQGSAGPFLVLGTQRSIANAVKSFERATFAHA